MADTEAQQTQGQCSRKCGGCKFLAGVLVGLLVAGTALGVYLAGRCHGHGRFCPMATQPAPQPQSR